MAKPCPAQFQDVGYTFHLEKGIIYLVSGAGGAKLHNEKLPGAAFSHHALHRKGGGRPPFLHAL